MIAHRLVYLVVGAMLFFAQRGRLFEHAAQFGEAVDFLFIYLEQAAFHRLVQHGIAHAGAFQQVFLAHLLDFAALYPARHVQVGQQQRLLFWRPLELVKVLMQSLFILTGQCQADTRLGLWTVVVDDTLAHVQCIQVQQVADISFYGLESGRVCNFGNLNASTLGRKVQNHLFAVTQLAGFALLKVWVDADCRFAFHLEARRYCRFINLAHCAQVVVGDPLPEVQLRVAHDGFIVERAQNLFHVVALGLPVMQGHHDGREDFFASEWHQNTHTDG